MKAKSIFASKTLFVNWVMSMVAVLTMLDPTLLDIDPLLVLLGTCVVNIALRLVTCQPVSINWK